MMPNEGDLVSYVGRDGKLYTDYYRKPTPGLADPPRTWWQRTLRKLTPKRWRKPLRQLTPIERHQLMLRDIDRHVQRITR